MWKYNQNYHHLVCTFIVLSKLHKLFQILFINENQNLYKILKEERRHFGNDTTKLQLSGFLLSLFQDVERMPQIVLKIKYYLHVV